MFDGIVVVGVTLVISLTLLGLTLELSPQTRSEVGRLLALVGLVALPLSTLLVPFAYGGNNWQFVKGTEVFLLPLTWLVMLPFITRVGDLAAIAEQATWTAWFVAANMFVMGALAAMFSTTIDRKAPTRIIAISLSLGLVNLVSDERSPSTPGLGYYTLWAALILGSIGMWMRVGARAELDRGFWRWCVVVLLVFAVCTLHASSIVPLASSTVGGPH